MKSNIIVVGSDLTDTSDAALAYALYLAPRLDARVVVAHVVESPELPRGARGSFKSREIAAFRQVRDSQYTSADQLLTRQLRRVRATPEEVAVEIRTGKPSAELLASAREKHASLLLLGMANQSGGPGVVAQRVLAGTRRPTLIVPSVPLSALPVRLPTEFNLSVLPRPRKRAAARGRRRRPPPALVLKRR